MDPAPSDPAEPTPPRLGAASIFGRFLRFGCVAFGGPIAQIAWLEDRFVRRERWISPERFRRTLAVYQALPGPEAHELCCHFGMISGGRLGAIAAGLGFLLPGLLLMLGAAWLYGRFGGAEALADPAFAAAQGAVVGLVARASLRLLGSLVHGRWGWIAAALGFLSTALHAPFGVPLVAGGAILAASRTGRRGLAGVTATAALATAIVFAAPDGRAELAAPAAAASPGRIFATGLVGGLVTFGGAYTAIPVVEEMATGPHGWTDGRTFLDGVAIATILPAPLVVFVTFVGFVGGGVAGGLLASLGMFLPAFSFVLLGHERFERLLERPGWHAFLDGVAAAVAGMVLATALAMLATVTGIGPGGAANVAPLPLATAAAAFATVTLWRSGWAAPSAVAGAALAGLVLR